MTLRIIGLLVAAVGVLGAPALGFAQEDYQVVRAFVPGPPNEGEGWPIAGLVKASDGNMYGSTITHFFKVAPDGTFTTINAVSTFWWDPIQGADGFLYSGDSGVIARISLSGDWTEVNATRTVADGQFTGPVVFGNDEALYGAKRLNGASGLGTIYRLTLDGAITDIHSFTPAEGDGSYTRLIKGLDGNFYGNLAFGGTGDGAIFRMTPDGTLTTIHSFEGPRGRRPMAALFEDPDGTFYGTTAGGGASGDYGVVFSLRPDGTYTVLHSFTGTFGDGAGSTSPLTPGSGGLLYGVTENTIFSITRDGEFRLLHRTGTEAEIRRYGRDFRGATIQGADGNLYGTFRVGGPFSTGGVYRLNTVRSACANVLDLLFIPNDPALRITQFVKTERPAFWGAWIAINGQVAGPLWVTVVPPITPTVGFYVPIPGFPPVGQVDVVSVVVTSTLDVCFDVKTIQTTPPATARLTAFPK